ncbi:unnamed protein product, partial [Ixodes pacificus]
STLTVCHVCRSSLRHHQPLFLGSRTLNIGANGPFLFLGSYIDLVEQKKREAGRGSRRQDVRGSARPLGPGTVRRTPAACRGGLRWRWIRGSREHQGLPRTLPRPRLPFVCTIRLPCPSASGQPRLRLR